MPPKLPLARSGASDIRTGSSDRSPPATSVVPSPRRKRESESDLTKEGTPTKKKRSSAKERSADDPYNPQNNLVDSLRPGLILVICGLNPGLQTAATGHAYAHPTNLFWRLLHDSGITTKRHLPSETHNLPDLYSIGNTNICARPTRDGSSLSKEELQEGARILEDKMREVKPEAIAIVGKSIWEALWLARSGKKLKPKDFRYGWQEEETWIGRTTAQDGTVTWPGARVYVTTTTSGLAANMKPHEKLEIWKPLGDWFTQRRKERSSEDEEERSGEHEVT